MAMEKPKFTIRISPADSEESDNIFAYISGENGACTKAKAVSKLLEEIENGWQSAKDEGWVSEEGAHRILGVSE